MSAQPLFRYAFLTALMAGLLLAGTGFSRAQENDAPIFQKLEDMLRLAYIENPDLRAARAELRATNELLPQALAGWRPSVNASADITKAKMTGSNFGAAEGSTSKTLEMELTQPVYRGGRTLAETESAYNAILARQAMVQGKEQDVLLAAATVYMNVLRDQALLDLAINNREVIAKQLEATRDRYEVGELTKTDVAQAESRLARADADNIQARGAVKASYAAYERVMGRAPETLGYPILRFPFPDDLDQAVLKAEQDNPSVLAAELLYRSSEEDIESVFGELLPELNIAASWDKSYDPQPGLSDESSSKTIGLVATIPLYSGGSTRSRVRQAKHTANQRYLEIISVRRGVREQIIENWEALATAKAVSESKAAQVKAAALAQEGVHQEAELGGRTILDSLDADQEMMDAQVDLVIARRDMVVASFALAATIGMLTPEILGFSDVAEDYNRELQAAKWKILGMDVDIDGNNP
ncbi:MAG: TolC family outer membrane protein [Rhodospirillales bacterium]|nr:TolC family outer membrane protein [Rhodospirillales bacterium]